MRLSLLAFSPPAREYRGHPVRGAQRSLILDGAGEQARLEKVTTRSYPGARVRAIKLRMVVSLDYMIGGPVAGLSAAAPLSLEHEVMHVAVYVYPFTVWSSLLIPLRERDATQWPCG
jgi:hypothetical protein